MKYFEVILGEIEAAKSERQLRKACEELILNKKEYSLKQLYKAKYEAQKVIKRLSDFDRLSLVLLMMMIESSIDKMGTVQKSSIELATEYLNFRAISCKGTPGLEQHDSVIPTWEVSEVLKMVEDGSFGYFYNRVQNIVKRGD